MKKIYVIIAASLAILLVTTVGVVLSINGPEGVPLIRNPKPVLPANKDLTRDKLMPLSSIVASPEKLEEVGAIVEWTKLMTLKEYAKLTNQEASSYPEISPDRLVYVSKVRYPEGIEHPRLGFLGDAEVITLRDAETGRFLENTWRWDDKNPKTKIRGGLPPVGPSQGEK